MFQAPLLCLLRWLIHFWFLPAKVGRYYLRYRMYPDLRIHHHHSVWQDQRLNRGARQSESDRRECRRVLRDFCRQCPFSPEARWCCIQSRDFRCSTFRFLRRSPMELSISWNHSPVPARQLPRAPGVRIRPIPVHPGWVVCRQRTQTFFQPRHPTGRPPDLKKHLHRVRRRRLPAAHSFAENNPSTQRVMVAPHFHPVRVSGRQFRCGCVPAGCHTGLRNEPGLVDT